MSSFSEKTHSAASETGGKIGDEGESTAPYVEAAMAGEPTLGDSIAERSPPKRRQADPRSKRKRQNGAARSICDPSGANDQTGASDQADGVSLSRETAARETMPNHGAVETSFEILATMLGFQAARQLTGKYGGRRIYLPDRVTRTHPLAKLMGWPGAKALCAQYAPGWIAVPLGPNATALQRRQRVQLMSDAGYTIAAIAKTLGVHTRTVERHRAILKAEAEALERQEKARMDQAIYGSGSAGCKCQKSSEGQKGSRNNRRTQGTSPNTEGYADAARPSSQLAAK
ncbi:MAG: helix-turn-helix domain-containing protein [Alphaproteobacteria bacterium]